MNTKYQPLTVKQTHSQGSKQLLKLLEQLEDVGEATILNNCGESTTDKGTTIDLSITLGKWEDGFAHPITVDLGSNHYPVCIGFKTQDNKANKIKYINMPNFGRTKQDEERIKNRCKEIDNNIRSFNGNTLAQEIINIYKPMKLPRTRKNKKKKNHWWGEHISKIFQEKQEHLGKSCCAKQKCKIFKEINEKLRMEITEAKNICFQEYASKLDHRDGRSNVFKAIKTFGVRPSSRISQLAVRDKSGVVVADLQQKTEIFARRYQIPLGSHPVRSKQRRLMLKANRRKYEEEAIKLEKRWLLKQLVAEKVP